MKLHQLITEYQERERIPNPLNGGEVPQEVYDFMDELDEIESAFHDAVHNHVAGGDVQSRIQETRREINKLGKVQNIDINKLIPMEPDYDKAHTDSITKSDPATVYLHNGKYYIGDGNHRVLADYNKGQQQTSANVINVQDIIDRTHQLDLDNI